MLVLPISRDVAGGPRGLVFSPGWYGVVLVAQRYTRQGGTNMVQTNNGCQGRRITKTTAARGGDPKTRLLGASIHQLVLRLVLL